MQVWLHSFPRPGTTADAARAAEAAGYDGLMVADSQNLTADIWVELALAAAATERLRLGPGVTNPRTRHPAVTASAAATLAAESGGRVTLGFGRGDSALTQIGGEPTPAGEFERGLEALQGYLAGEAVDLEGFSGKIAWLPREGEPKVPVAVAATGPRVIAAAARLAEEVDFTVGAEEERLRWAVETARSAAEAAGRGEAEAAGRSEAETAGRGVDSRHGGGGTATGADGRDEGARAGAAWPGAPLRLGAYVNVAVADDRATARDLIRGSTSTLARFGTEGAPADGLSTVTREGIEQLGAAYHEAQHGQSAGAAAQGLSDEFIDRFAVCGPVDEVTSRLLSLRDLGLERLIVVPGSLDADPRALAEANVRFEREVLPALRHT
jgi:5,10-methylenetetrahydromethanopterin reductase